MKRLVLSMVSIIVLLSMLVSCQIFNEFNELSEEETKEVYCKFVSILKEENVFENGCVFLVGDSILVIDQGEKVYYHCNQEQITEINELFEIVKDMLVSLENEGNSVITGWDYGATSRLCTIENIEGIKGEKFLANSVQAYFPGGKDQSVHINFYNSDGSNSKTNVELYLKYTSQQIDEYLEVMVSYSQ